MSYLIRSEHLQNGYNLFHQLNLHAKALVGRSRTHRYGP